MAMASDPAIDALTKEHDAWERDGNSLVAQFEFKDFAGAMEFVNRVAEMAESADHHPDIDIRWNKVRLVLSTHSEGGVTQKDLDLARQIISA
ncbi:MAG TPA: 4a-hydroxytetrahydrobiopterin dehydratase [Acidimicrobiia bacterium]|nr:4a-hydroxytetrahydrobiopterin dehydratase [Acidimicrobiia bacterium]